MKVPDVDVHPTMVDNIAKFVLDALQPAVLSDDKLVITVVVSKHWTSSKDKECTCIELRVLE